MSVLHGLQAPHPSSGLGVTCAIPASQGGPTESWGSRKDASPVEAGRACPPTSSPSGNGLEMCRHPLPGQPALGRLTPHPNRPASRGTQFPQRPATCLLASCSYGGSLGLECSPVHPLSILSRGQMPTHPGDPARGFSALASHLNLLGASEPDRGCMRI